MAAFEKLGHSQKNGWLNTGLFAYVNPDGVTATAGVTHFSHYILMGQEEEDINYYFGSFKTKYFDICSPSPTIDLYNEFQNLWSTYYFPIGDKSVWDFSAHYPDRDYACYKVSGIRFTLISSRSVPDEEGGWVEIENKVYDQTIGDVGPIVLVFLDHTRQVA